MWPLIRRESRSKTFIAIHDFSLSDTILKDGHCMSLWDMIEMQDVDRVSGDGVLADYFLDMMGYR